MTVMVAPMGDSSDRVLLDVNIDKTYWDYLNSFGVTTPHPFQKGMSEQLKGIAWGWNRESRSRLELLGASCNCANFDIIRNINSRKFCSDLALKITTGVPRSQFCSTVEQVIKACYSLREHFPLVIKPAFGGSGYGFIHCESFEEFESKCSSFPQFPDGAVVEPWCNKINDLSSVCEIKPNGTISQFRYQRTLTNSRGTFYGIYFEQDDPVINRWKGALEDASLMAVQEVAATGYFGPLGFDSFTYEELGEEKLAAVIEINARHVMSDIAHEIRKKCAPRQCCMYRFLNKKRCKLPETYDQLHSLLQGIEFNHRYGCFLTTPLRVAHGSEWTQPYRNAFFITGDSLEEVLNIDKELRARTNFPHRA